MRKEKNQKDYRSRSYSPKLYLGCDTCKTKYNDLPKVKSSSKLSDCNEIHEKTKVKKINEKYDHENKKIKFTDLCDDDKKRIVELIEELSRLADKNLQLKDALEKSEKGWKDQQEYINKQCNLHADEKNFYINEINGHRRTIENLETELKNQLAQWKNQARQKDNEIIALGKALQKSLNEKNDLHEQINHLRICLKHSLESFQKLRSELAVLQSQDRKISVSTMCQTEKMALDNFYSATDEETEVDECTSIDDKKLVHAKSSLDLINDKLEDVYKLLRKKSEILLGNCTKKIDVDLSIFFKNQNKSADENREEDLHLGLTDDPVLLCSDEDKGNYKFLKPFDQCSKTSVQAERILKTIGKPLSIILRETTQKLENNNVDNLKSKDSLTGNLCSNILRNKIIQKNNLFKSAKDQQYMEDRLLEDLFYSDKV